MTNPKRDKLAEAYRDRDFANNPNGYTVSPYCNSDTTSEAFIAGWDAAIKNVTENSSKDNNTLKDVMTQAEALAEVSQRLLERIDANGGIGEYKSGPAFVVEPCREALAAFQKFKDGL